MKLISTLIAIAFASTLSFGAVAAQHMGAAPTAAPAATEAAPAAAPAKKAKKAKAKKAKKAKAMTGDAAAK
jgi:ribosomal protein L12E/L44/L45/RPP1/RPP2